MNEIPGPVENSSNASWVWSQIPMVLEEFRLLKHDPVITFEIGIGERTDEFYSLKEHLTVIVTKALVVDGHISAERYKQLVTGTPDLRIRAVHNGFKAGEKICMVDISCDDYKLRYVHHPSSTTLRVTLNSKQQESPTDSRPTPRATPCIPTFLKQ